MFSFFSISPANISETTGNMFSIFESIKPLFILLVGIVLGIWLLESIVSIVREKTERRRMLEEKEKELTEKALAPAFRRLREHEIEEKRAELFREA